MVVIEIECGRQVEPAGKKLVFRNDLHAGVRSVGNIGPGAIHHVGVDIAQAVHHVGSLTQICRHADHVESPAFQIIQFERIGIFRLEIWVTE